MRNKETKNLKSNLDAGPRKRLVSARPPPASQAPFGGFADLQAFRGER
jgi:hypothetical protein